MSCKIKIGGYCKSCKLVQFNDKFVFQNFIIKIIYSKNDYPIKIIYEKILDNEFSFDSCDYDIFKDSIIYKIEKYILQIKKNENDKYFVFKKITMNQICVNYYNLWILPDNFNEKILLLYNSPSANENKIFIINSSLTL